jgi:hypothetical protein
MFAIIAVVLTRKSVLIESIELEQRIAVACSRRVHDYFFVVTCVWGSFQTRAALQAEILALRHQLLFLQRPWAEKTDVQLRGQNVG